ncbi:MAG: ribose 5-phosphate isomerase A [Vulcanimicrobiaceae bacterium]
MDSPIERAKRLVAQRAVDTYVRTGTCIGLGTGSTARYAVERTGERIRDGLAVTAVATSLETERLCRDNGVPLVAFGDEPIDVAIDGADEVAPDWALIKGGGGALFREKAVALAARAFVVIVTRAKCVERLGAFPLPVEVVPFSTPYVAREIEALGAAVTLRRGPEGRAFASDNGNAILDCRFGTIPSPAVLDRILREFHGVVATGLFVRLTSAVFVADDDGGVAELRAPARTISARA